ncbi:hypothetical protein AB0H18_22800 [Streptomyces sp. NPDC020766]|uniref:hypothetical protein n=1 Tax=Streptomyces sp. NPDC020766 TaxID=3155011 RepID=UPI0033F56E43
MDRRGTLADWASEFTVRHGLEDEEQAHVLGLVAERAYPSTFDAIRTRYRLTMSTAEMWRVYCTDIAAMVSCPAAVLDGLDELRAAKWRVGVATNGAVDIQRAKLRATGISERVEGVFVSEEADARKPQTRHSRGHIVLWCPDGRSDTTRRRAEHGGLEAEALPELISRSDVLLSLCPPAAAEDTAAQVAVLGMAGVGTIYVEANAVSPSRVQRIANRLAPMPVIDAAVVGSPLSGASLEGEVHDVDGGRTRASCRPKGFCPTIRPFARSTSTVPAPRCRRGETNQHLSRRRTQRWAMEAIVSRAAAGKRGVRRRRRGWYPAESRARASN